MHLPCRDAKTCDFAASRGAGRTACGLFCRTKSALPATAGHGQGTSGLLSMTWQSSIPCSWIRKNSGPCRMGSISEFLRIQLQKRCRRSLSTRPCDRSRFTGETGRDRIAIASWRELPRRKRRGCPCEHVSPTMRGSAPVVSRRDSPPPTSITHRCLPQTSLSKAPASITSATWIWCCHEAS